MTRKLATVALLACVVSAGRLPAQTPAPAQMQYSGWMRATPTHLGAFGPTTWLRMDTVTNWVMMPGSPGEVYRKSMAAYGALKLKLTMQDSLTGLLGNLGFNHTGALAGRRMSSWLSCGEGMAGPNADTWRITLAVITWVEPMTTDSTKLRSTIMATARNLAEGSRAPMPCVTTGQLEHQIHQKVRALLSTPGGNE